MFGGIPTNNGLSMGKVLGGISKTLNVVNQIIPLYKEAKPIFNNARTAMSLIKEFGNTATNKVNSNVEKNIRPIKEKVTAINSNLSENKKGPTFFV